MRALTRVPKRLEEPAKVFDITGGGSGLALRARGRSAPRATGAGTRPVAATGPTDEGGETINLALEPDRSVDDLWAKALEIAMRLSIRPPQRGAGTVRGTGDLYTLPYRGTSDDLDLDRTLEVIAGQPIYDESEILVRERTRTQRSIVLAIDVSGSMRGERIITAAAAIGALASQLHRDNVAVIAFWSDVAVLATLGSTIDANQILDALSRIPAQGLTNISWPIEVALRELERRPTSSRRILLLSDCVHNAGPDPRLIAAKAPRLDVMLDVSGEHDALLGAELSKAGHGSMRVVRSHRDVVKALEDIFVAR